MIIKNSKGVKKGYEAYKYADSYEFIAEHFYLLEPDKIWTIEEIMQQAEYAVKRYGVKTLVIDPYSCL